MINGFYFYGGEYGTDTCNTIELECLTIEQVLYFEKKYKHEKPNGFYIFVNNDTDLEIDPEVLRYLRKKPDYFLNS